MSTDLAARDSCHQLRKLNARFRNLLITIAREAEALKAETLEMEFAIPEEPSKGKQAGMRTLINCRRRQLARLDQMLRTHHDSAAIFFGTTIRNVIAQHEIRLL